MSLRNKYLRALNNLIAANEGKTAEFVESCRGFFEKNDYLTPSQFEAVKRITERTIEREDQIQWFEKMAPRFLAEQAAILKLRIG